MKEKIKDYIRFVIKIKDTMYYYTIPIRLSTVYWYTASMRILGYDVDEKEKIVKFVMECKCEDGFFGANKNYTSNLTSTLNALQIFYTLNYCYYDEMILNNLHKYQNTDESFRNDLYGETDTRFTCCAILITHILYLNQKYKSCDIAYLNDKYSYEFVHKYKFDVDMGVNYVLQCVNFDGGFGASIGDESHCANTFCCVSSLKVLNLLDLLDTEKLCRFLVNRQTENGGLNGRVNKKEDVCYSFWTFSCLQMIKKDSYISKTKLVEFIYECYDGTVGGFSDRKGNEVDLYHTLYSLASLSMLQKADLAEVNPAYGM
ncbi:Rab geranylgeranyltransferase [Binucleata daphniae]